MTSVLSTMSSSPNRLNDPKMQHGSWENGGKKLCWFERKTPLRETQLHVRLSMVFS